MPLFLKRSKLKLQSVDGAGNNALVRRDRIRQKMLLFSPLMVENGKRVKKALLKRKQIPKRSTLRETKAGDKYISLEISFEGIFAQYLHAIHHKNQIFIKLLSVPSNGRWSKTSIFSALSYIENFRNFYVEHLADDKYFLNNTSVQQVYKVYITYKRLKRCLEEVTLKILSNCQSQDPS